MYHLQTFYAGLAHRIRLQDCLFKGKFLETTYDLMFEYPCGEMARDHVRAISDVLYVYNEETPLSDNKLREFTQHRMSEYVRALPSYQVLQTHPKEGIVSPKRFPIDLFIIDNSTLKNLKVMLLSIQKEITGYDNVYVCVDNRYPDLMNDFHRYKFIKKRKIYKFIKNQYVTVLPTSATIEKTIDLQKGAKEIFRRGVLGFSYEKNSIPSFPINLEESLWAQELLLQDQEKWTKSFSKFCLYRPDALRQKTLIFPNYLILSNVP